MASAMTIIALGAVVIFGIWYISGNGCKGDGSNGMTGPNGSLCFDSSLIGFPKGKGEGEDIAEPVEGAEDEDVPIEDENTAAEQFVEDYPRGIHPATPSKSSLAHAFAAGLRNQITIA